MHSHLLKYFLLMLIFHCFYWTKCNITDKIQVFINNDEFRGSIVGKRFQDQEVEFIGFRGIPYAKPPIKELRFKDPQNLDRFEGTLDATHDGYECCSITAHNGSEDCLNLNVYTKQLRPFKLKPVVVLIHPGGLYLGSGASFYMKPNYMMTQDLVLVTFNYRLGALGFLNLGTAEIPGNAGFKDQVYALRWVHKYIKYFGGDPQDVTLMGYSAGALSVQLHLMSLMSQHLFHKAIIMSGSLAPQIYLAQQQKYLAARLAKRLNCEHFRLIEEEIPYGVEQKFSDYETVENKDILECLNQHNGTAIANTLRPMFDFFKDNPIFLWLPIFERDFKQERFLAENISVARKNTLIGCTNEELGASAKDILVNDADRRKFSNEFDNLAPRAFLYERHPNRHVITAKIKQKFFNVSTDFSLKDYEAITDVFSDTIIRYGGIKLAEFLSQNGGLVYFYEFSFVEDYKNKSNDFPGKQDRCQHMMDLQYLFNWSGRKHDTESEKKMVQIYTGFMYDFIKHGKLTDPKAKPYPHSCAQIKENIEYKEGCNFKNYEFWQELFPKYFNYNLK